MFDFGTIQTAKSFTAEPGENITATVYFFIDNQYGDRNTHINLAVGRLPSSDWNITFNPAVHEVILNISGILTSFNENLYTEPKPLLQELPAEAEPGYVYIRSPSGKGYLQAKPLNITIYVPKNASYGNVYDISIDATASWFGETGQIQLSQSRNFEYKVLVASKIYSEEIVKKPLDNTSNVTGDFKSGQTPPIDQNIILYGVIGVLTIIILALVAKNFIPLSATKHSKQALQELKEIHSVKTKDSAKKRRAKKSKKKGRKKRTK